MSSECTPSAEDGRSNATPVPHTRPRICGSSRSRVSITAFLNPLVPQTYLRKDKSEMPFAPELRHISGPFHAPICQMMNKDNKLWQLSGFSRTFLALLLVPIFFPLEAPSLGPVSTLAAAAIQILNPAPASAFDPGCGNTALVHLFCRNGHVSIPVCWTMHGNYSSRSNLQTPEIGEKVIGAIRSKLAQQSLGSNGPKATSCTGFRSRVFQVSEGIDDQNFKMRASYVTHLFFGLLIALGRCFLLKTRKMTAFQRVIDEMKKSKRQQAQTTRNFVLRFHLDFISVARSTLLMLIAVYPSIVESQTTPITSGLIAHYNADSWTGSRWTDLSGADNHVTEIGGNTSIAIARPVGAPAYIYGAPTAWMKFPEGILPSTDYTLFFVARHNGAARGRIFQGVSTNWLSGFHDKKAGVAYRGSTCWITKTQDEHGLDWVIGADRPRSFRSNGLDRTTNAAACDFPGRIAINAGMWATESSDFAVQSVLVYNRRLTDAEVMRVEAWLTSLQPSFTPASLQVSACC
jgi:hypothetical protein